MGRAEGEDLLVAGGHMLLARAGGIDLVHDIEGGEGGERGGGGLDGLKDVAFDARLGLAQIP